MQVLTETIVVDSRVADRIIKTFSEPSYEDGSSGFGSVIDKGEDEPEMCEALGLPMQRKLTVTAGVIGWMTIGTIKESYRLKDYVGPSTPSYMFV